MIYQGDCLDIMKSMDDNSIDFIVTDPPYGLNFMGKKWDKIPAIEIWIETLRICKPGAMLAAFGGTRTHHHLMLAQEQAGWEIRDVIMYIYGQGFPKSHNFGKKLGGIWEPYGTALKPAYEPIIIAMKPLDGTFAHNAQKWGVAGINIDSSRIEAIDQDKLAKNWDRETITDMRSGNYGNGIAAGIKLKTEAKQGRWPSNLILDEESAKQLDEMTGIRKSARGKCNAVKKNPLFEESKGLHTSGRKTEWEGYADSGGASRFFYCAKASPSERNRGLERMPLKEISGCYGEFAGDGRGREHTPSRNTHPTIKPISLMKYILKLLAPPGDPICLDPFAGSGTTLLAAQELGIRCIGIEKETEYCDIARKRLETHKTTDQK